MSKEITREEAALLWAQKRRVETRRHENESWGLIRSLGELEGIAAWECGVFTSSIPFKFRLAPEPPAKRYRPWTPEEVPVGALTKPNHGGDVLMIIGIRGRGVLLAGDSGDYPLRGLLNLREHSLDNGKTWLPCGVEVSE